MINNIFFNRKTLFAEKVRSDNERRGKKHIGVYTLYYGTVKISIRGGFALENRGFFGYDKRKNGKVQQR
jgi:hypothetical protein